MAEPSVPVSVPLSPRDRILPLATAIAATLAVQWMALRSDFMDDDFLYFYANAKWGTTAALMRPYGNHFMASFRLVVASLHTLFGLHPFPYFAVVLLTHLAHVALFYGIVRALSGSRPVAAVAAGLWGTAPAFQGTLQSFASYSHMLSTTAVLWPLWEMTRAAEARRPPTMAALVRTNLVLVFGAATMICGSITAALFPAVTLLLLPRTSRPVRTALWLLPAAVLSVALVASSVGDQASIVTAIPVAASLFVFFALLVYGVGLVVAGPLLTVHADPDGIGVFSFGSYDTAVAASAVVFATLLAVVVWRLVRGDSHERRVLLALLGLAAALYAGITIGRGWLPFGNSLTYLATRDRYHYDANAGLIIAIAIAIARIRPRLAWPKRPQARIVLGMVAAGWVVGCFLTAKATYVDGAGPLDGTRVAMDRIDAAIMALAEHTPEDGTLFVRNDAFEPAARLYILGASKADFPGTAAYWIIAHGVEPPAGRTLRFVEEDPQVLTAIRADSRPEVAAMFVAREDVTRANAAMVGIEAAEPFLPAPLPGRFPRGLAIVVNACRSHCLPNPILRWSVEHGCQCAPAAVDRHDRP